MDTLDIGLTNLSFCPAFTSRSLSYWTSFVTGNACLPDLPIFLLRKHVYVVSPNNTASTTFAR
jgi:hypothetical protein